MTNDYLAMTLAFALLLDAWWGEPRRWHPLIGFGHCAVRIERRLNRGRLRIARGLCGWALLVAPPVAAAALLQQWLQRWPLPLALLAQALVVYFAVGLQSLREHAHAVLVALHAEDLPWARHMLSMMVSRDTQTLNSTEISRAATESVLENGSDAVIASLFWFCVAGLPGVVLHRAANTLDAMWGYRNERFNEFGRCAARSDDALNFIPARITAFGYLLFGYLLRGSARAAWRCWREQARGWSSPNAGPVMAAGAGALNVRLGGAAYYRGEYEHRGLLGCGREPMADDIARALQLVRGVAIALVAVVALLGILL